MSASLIANRARRVMISFLKDKPGWRSDNGLTNKNLRDWCASLKSVEIKDNEAAINLLGTKSGKNFYGGAAWLKVRYRALLASNGSCQCCGARGDKENPLHVDHIKPRSKYPELQYEISNLQVLCCACNFGKRDKDETDWRPVACAETGSATVVDGSMNGMQS